MKKLAFALFVLMLAAPFSQAQDTIDAKAYAEKGQRYCREITDGSNTQLIGCVRHMMGQEEIAVQIANSAITIKNRLNSEGDVPTEVLSEGSVPIEVIELWCGQQFKKVLTVILSIAKTAQ